MLEIKIGEGSHYTIDLQGDLEEVIVDTMRAVNGIYRALFDTDKELGEAYMVMIRDAVGEANSPVWTHNPDRESRHVLLAKGRSSEEVQP